MKRIDSHVHLWDRERFTYDWLEEGPSELRRDFLPFDLAEHLAAASVDEVVVVQADCRSEQALDEASWMHEVADRGSPILAVVAFAPLETDCLDHLSALAELPLVTGVRRLLQDEPAGFAVSDRLVAGVGLLAQFGFSMDLCVRQHQLAEIVELARRCPDVSFVLDHLGKPVIAAASFEPWARQVSELAALPNLTCKVSGLLTEAPRELRHPAALSPWLRHAVDVFGAERCMFGSDWPVLTTAADDATWLHILDTAFAGASSDERHALFAGTAQRIYGAQ